MIVVECLGNQTGIGPYFGGENRLQTCQMGFRQSILFINQIHLLRWISLKRALCHSCRSPRRITKFAQSSWPCDYLNLKKKYTFRDVLTNIDVKILTSSNTVVKTLIVDMLIHTVSYHHR